MCGYCLLQHLGWCRELFDTDQQSCSLPSPAPFLLLHVSLTARLYVPEGNARVYQESSQGHSCLFGAQAPSDAAVEFHTLALSNLSIKTLAPAATSFLIPALSRLVSIHEWLCAVCLPLSLQPRRAARPTVQTSDLNQCPEREAGKLAQPCTHNSELLGRRQAMPVGFSLCCLIKTREREQALPCTLSSAHPLLQWHAQTHSAINAALSRDMAGTFWRTRHLADLFQNLILNGTSGCFHFWCSWQEKPSTALKWGRRWWKETFPLSSIINT